jgi:hypothetical protein
MPEDGGVRHRDRGESLVEILVSISILGVAGSAILGAVGMASSSSTLHRNLATSQNLVRNWAEAVTAADYVKCAGPGAFDGTKPNLTADQYKGYSATVSAVRYWDGTTFGTACSAATDTGLQRVSLVISAPASMGPSFDQTLDVVVRRPCTSAC